MLGTAGATVKSCLVKLDPSEDITNNGHPIQIELDLSGGNVGTLFMTNGEAAHLAAALNVALNPAAYTSSNIVKS
tara:strand:+ start:1424 stop:1648 length:225 start_codon:yes stop_codon:yes gene_type:complete